MAEGSREGETFHYINFYTFVFLFEPCECTICSKKINFKNLKVWMLKTN